MRTMPASFRLCIAAANLEAMLLPAADACIDQLSEMYS